MKNKNCLNLFGLLFVTACTTVPDNYQFTDLQVSHNAINSNKFDQLIRFPARYPVKAARNSIEGCATIEYVVTPNYEIKDIKVVSSTKSYFAESAKKVIRKWNWSDLPTNELEEPIKTQTKFEFCLDKPNSPCSTRAVSKVCPGEDIIYTTGSLIKRKSA